jgi:hypothetical protein
MNDDRFLIDTLYHLPERALYIVGLEVNRE